MLVEVNSKGQTHEEHAPETMFSAPCNGKISEKHRYCLNCGFRPDHVRETGAEIVIHMDWENRNLPWYDKHLRLRTPQGRLLAGE